MFRQQMSYILVNLMLLLAFASSVAADECLIAVVKSKDRPHQDIIHQFFTENLLDTQCRIYVQSPNADYMSFRNSARKAVAIGADLIVSYGTTATLAAQVETHDARILFADVYDPVAQKLVSKQGMPMYHATGIRGDAPIQTLLKAYLETTGANRLAVIFDPKNPVGVYQVKILEDIGAKKGFSVHRLPLTPGQDLDVVLGQLSQGEEGLFITDCSKLDPLLPTIMSYAYEHQIAVISQSHGMAELGCLMSLETDPAEQGTVLADLAKQVIAGEDTNKIKLVLPKKVSLTINLKIANRFGYKVPFEILAMTTKVIR